MTLNEYVRKHVERGECQCGKCADAPPNPESKQPVGHTVDLTFCKVKLKGEPRAEELRELIKAHNGAFGELDLFDKKEHNYLEIGAWLGDQGCAIMLIGMGHLLGLWHALSPDTMLPFLPQDTKMEMAENGMVCLQSSEGEAMTIPFDDGCPFQYYDNEYDVEDRSAYLVQHALCGHEDRSGLPCCEEKCPRIEEEKEKQGGDY